MTTKLDGLLSYYLECIRREPNRGASVLLSEQNQRWLELPLPKEWHHHTSRHVTLADSILDCPFGQSALTSRLLFYGYPLHITQGAENTSNALLVPVFLQPVTAMRNESGLRLELSKEPAVLNANFLGAIAYSPEERKQLIHIFKSKHVDITRTASLIDVLNAFASVPLRERIDPHLPMTPLGTPNAEGLYNRAIVLLGNPTTFTSDLETELHTLQQVPDDICITALGSLISQPSEATCTNTDVFEVTPLDDSQRSSVESAMHKTLTVVTGPPGTGKSQVVVATLASALIHGQSVLFASRNHKAVNVVEERMKSLTDMPVLMRAGLRSGSRDLRRAFVEILATLLLQPQDGTVAAQEQAKRRYQSMLRHRHYLSSKLDRIVQEHAQHNTCNLQPPVSGTSWSKADRSVVEDIAQYAHCLRSAGLLRRIYYRLTNPQRNSRWRQLQKQLRTDPTLGTNPPRQSIFTAPHRWYEYLVNELKYQEFTSTSSNNSDNLSTLPLRMGEALLNASSNVAKAGEALLKAHLDARITSHSDKTREDLAIYRTALQRILDDPQSDVSRQLQRQLASRFETLLDALPLWSVTNLSVHTSIPLAPGLFDLLIIDEAGQSDIPSALPLLYRAKRALIIGDPQQLRHVSALGIDTDHALQSKNGLTSIQDQRYGYSRCSLFDLAASRAHASVHLLSSHYRSHADLIGFANTHWYRNSLNIKTRYEAKKTTSSLDTITWIETQSAAKSVRSGGITVQAETQGVESALTQLARSGFTGSIGIIAPFRAQVGALLHLVAKFDAGWRTARQLHVATAHGFQGDERDLMIVSLCLANGMPRGAKRFLADSSHLLNVALTRARWGWIIVGDPKACRTMTLPYYQALWEYYQRHGAKEMVLEPRRDVFEGPEEATLFRALRDAGFDPIAQYPIDQYRVDLAVLSDPCRIAIEVDGVDFHTDDSGRRLRDDLIRDAHLRTLGWFVVRLWAHQVRNDVEDCVLQVKSTVSHCKLHIESKAKML